MQQEQLDQLYMRAAVEQAQLNIRAGERLVDRPFLPIGAAIAENGTLVALGRNHRVQLNDPTSHAEIDCLRNAGRFGVKRYGDATLYTSLYPCKMCGGAICLFGIKRIVVADMGLDIEGSAKWRTPPEYFKDNSVEVIQLDDRGMQEAFRKFVREHGDLWNEDVAQ